MHMKKVLPLTFASLFFLSLHSSAQITKGSVLLGGGISGSKSKTEDGSQGVNKSSAVVISPAVGIAVKNNSVVGLRLSYLHAKSELSNVVYPNLQEQNGYGIGAFYRRYAPLGKKFYLFGEGAVYYNHGSNKSEYTSAGSKSEQTNNAVGINFYPGIAYAVNRKIHLEVGLNNLVDLSYSKGKNENTSAGTTTTTRSSGFAMSTNVSTSTPLSVGFRFVLGK